MFTRDLKNWNFLKRRMQQKLFGEENFFMMDEYLRKKNELKIAWWKIMAVNNKHTNNYTHLKIQISSSFVKICHSISILDQPHAHVTFSKQMSLIWNRKWMTGLMVSTRVSHHTAPHTNPKNSHFPPTKKTFKFILRQTTHHHDSYLHLSNKIAKLKPVQQAATLYSPNNGAEKLKTGLLWKSGTFLF